MSERGEEDLEVIISKTRDLRYCHIWDDNPLEKYKTVELDSDDILIY